MDGDEVDGERGSYVCTEADLTYSSRILPCLCLQVTKCHEKLCKDAVVSKREKPDVTVAIYLVGVLDYVVRTPDQTLPNRPAVSLLVCAPSLRR
jgi:hypothetical protein